MTCVPYGKIWCFTFHISYFETNDTRVQRPSHNYWSNYPVEQSWLGQLRGLGVSAICIVSFVK